MNTKTLLAASLSFLLLTGCIPKIDKAAVISKTVVNSDVEKSIDVHDDNATQLVSDWWKGYGDLQLNRIIS